LITGANFPDLKVYSANLAGSGLPGGHLPEPGLINMEKYVILLLTTLHAASMFKKTARRGAVAIFLIGATSSAQHGEDRPATLRRTSIFINLRP